MSVLPPKYPEQNRICSVLVGTMEYIKTNLFTIISDLRYFLLTGFETLPLTLGGTMLIVGHLIGNYAMLFFLVGYMMVVPGALFLLNLFSPKEFPYGGRDMDICNVNTETQSEERSDMVVSYWMGMVAFFIGYMFTNTASIYMKQPGSAVTDGNGNGIGPNGPTPPDPSLAAKMEAGTTLRQTQTIMAFVALILITFVAVIIRLWSSCDGIVSILLGGAIGGGLGIGWYFLLAKVGDDRLSDLFGIANRLMVGTSLENLPYACLPYAN